MGCPKSKRGQQQAPVLRKPVVVWSHPLGAAFTTGLVELVRGQTKVLGEKGAPELVRLTQPKPEGLHRGSDPGKSDGKKQNSSPEPYAVPDQSPQRALGMLGLFETPNQLRLQIRASV